MTVYDFDTIIDRHGTGSLKYDCNDRYGKPEDILPLWVADMDFSVPEEVKQALRERVDHGIFGYTEPDDAYFQAVASWFERRHGWRPERAWLTTTPGVVYALAMAVRAFTQAGDAVLIQPPVYYPFKQEVELNGRVLAEAPLSLDDDTLSYTIDFGEFERAIADNNVKLFILCNPHNPVGRAWTQEELGRLARICIDHDVIVVSDEIHADFAREGFKHTVFASLSEEAALHCVVCTSATKSFNLAGLQASNIFIPNPELRERFQHENAAAGYSQANILGMTATRASYQAGEAWFDQLKCYLESNYQFMVGYLRENVPSVRVAPLESTYLVWVDCRAFGMNGDELQHFVEQEAKIWLDMGEMFGEQGAGFIRFNIACPRSVLTEALARFARAARERGL